MRQSFAHLVAAPFLLAAVLILYYAWTHNGAGAGWLVATLVPAAIVYVMAPQINWWWYSKRPPLLEPPMVQMLDRCSTPYQRLDAVCKQRFRERVALFRMGTEWTPLGWPEERVPADVQLALSAQAIALTLHKPVFLFKAFEKVIVYPNAFHSPEYPFLHGSELYQPDGCLIFSAEHVIKAFVKPNEFYNVGLHEYAKVFIRTYPDEAWPDVSAADAWERLEQVNGMTRGYIESVIGLAGVEALPVCIHHHFNFPEQLAAAWPEVSEILRAIFPGTCS